MGHMCDEGMTGIVELLGCQAARSSVRGDEKLQLDGEIGIAVDVGTRMELNTILTS